MDGTVAVCAESVNFYEILPGKSLPCRTTEPLTPAICIFGCIRDACAVIYSYFTIIHVPVHCLYNEKCCNVKAFSDIHAIVLQEKDQKCPSSILMSFGYVVV